MLRPANVSLAEWLPNALVMALAIGIGALAQTSSAFAIALAALGLLISLLFLGDRLTSVFLALITVLLIGYAFLDKAFAYIGVYPLFVSEIVLALAVLHLVISTRSWPRPTWLHWILIAFMVWGLLRTVPYLGNDAVNALRDGTLWGYALFALAIWTAIRPKHFARIVALYGCAILPFLIWTPIAGMIGRTYVDQIPTVLGSDVPILSLKAGDVGVQLAGVGAFVFAGLTRGFLTRRPVLVMLIAMWLVGVVVVGSSNRSALLAAMAALVVLPLVRPSRRLIGSFAVALVLGTVAVLAMPEVDMANARTLSAGQVVANVMSIVTDSGSDTLDGSKEWRTAWWNTIIGYTIDGPYFWTGKGFGINLATDDGFQTDSTGSLRSPHNAHLNVLARTGVPGLTLWALLQIGFGASLLWSLFRARRLEMSFWYAIDAWLLAYWLAMIVNAAFDVFFEGPQGGIWFWTIFGLGLAAIGIQRSLFAEAERAREASPPDARLVRTPHDVLAQKRHEPQVDDRIASP